MSKKFEKKIEKELEKSLFEKRKELKQEIKEKNEKFEKEKPEKNEWIEKNPKEFVEGGFPGGINVFRGEKPEEGAAAPKPIEKGEELKVQKEIEKIKPEKEFPDKYHKEKEIEKFKPEKEFPDKFQKELEKIKPEKEFEKLVVEGFEDPTKGELFKRSGSAEDRLSELEDAVTKLSHFIGVDLRPDLSTGALKGEADVQGGGTAGGEAKPDDKKKPR